MACVDFKGEEEMGMEVLFCDICTVSCTVEFENELNKKKEHSWRDANIKNNNLNKFQCFLILSNFKNKHKNVD